MNKDQLINGIKIEEQTLIGSFGDFPRKIGNCFSIVTESKKRYSIVNFVVENLEELLKREVIKWPIKILPISKAEAVICDERIPDEWYRLEYCATCCPDSLLPHPQKAKHLRQEMRGERTIIEKEGYVIKKVGKGEGKFVTSDYIPLESVKIIKRKIRPTKDTLDVTYTNKVFINSVERYAKMIANHLSNDPRNFSLFLFSPEKQTAIWDCLEKEYEVDIKQANKNSDYRVKTIIIDNERPEKLSGYLCDKRIVIVVDEHYKASKAVREVIQATASNKESEIKLL